MSNETTSAILSFAEKHHDFNIEDLSESLCKSMTSTDLPCCGICSNS